MFGVKDEQCSCPTSSEGIVRPSFSGSRWNPRALGIVGGNHQATKLDVTHLRWTVGQKTSLGAWQLFMLFPRCLGRGPWTSWSFLGQQLASQLGATHPSDDKASASVLFEGTGRGCVLGLFGATFGHGESVRIP